MGAGISPSPSPCFTGGFFPIFLLAEGCDDAFLLTSDFSRKYHTQGDSVVVPESSSFSNMHPPQVVAVEAALMQAFSYGFSDGEDHEYLEFLAK